MQRRILIGYDGSPEGDDALGLGRVLGGALEARTMVATVIRHARHGEKESELEEAVGKFCEPLFSSARERLNGAEVDERPLIDDSRPHAIYELADWEKPSLIVIGSTKRGPAGRVLVGSLGVSLLSGAPCAVAVAPRGYAEGEPRLERIGVAVDGSSECWRALAAGAALAGRLNQPLRMISVMEQPHYMLGGLLSPLGPEEYREQKQEQAEKVFGEAEERMSDDLPTERILLHGDPAEAIGEAASDLDLLIVGSRAYGPIKGALLGSVSSKLMSTAPCAVMVVARGAGTSPLDD